MRPETRPPFEVLVQSEGWSLLMVERLFKMLMLLFMVLCFYELMLMKTILLRVKRWGSKKRFTRNIEVCKVRRYFREAY